MVFRRGWASAIGAIVVVAVAACGPSAAASVDLPDVVGLHLDKAKDTLEKADFDTMTSRDASGGDRSQLIDSNWTVCRQDPPAGPSERGVRIVLYVVKNTEPCPAPAASATPAETSPPATPETSPPATPVVETRQVTETVPVPFDERTVDDPTLPAGTRVVRTPGVAGEKTITYEVTLTDGVESARKPIGETVTRQPVSQVVAVGTKRESGCDPNYSGACVPIASDVDCAGGSGNGPAYVRGPVRVIGTDIYDLDRDGNGVGCE